MPHAILPSSNVREYVPPVKSKKTETTNIHSAAPTPTTADMLMMQYNVTRRMTLILDSKSTVLFP